jgi:hypothetical protein
MSACKNAHSHTDNIRAVHRQYNKRTGSMESPIREQEEPFAAYCTVGRGTSDAVAASAMADTSKVASLLLLLLSMYVNRGPLVSN